MELSAGKQVGYPQGILAGISSKQKHHTIAVFKSQIFNVNAIVLSQARP